MGYSCTARAAFVRDAIQKIIDRECPQTDGSSNRTPDGGFWEIGRENADGAITGTVWKPAGEGYARKRGSFKIDADGAVKRFPGLPAKWLREAEAIGATKYTTTYGGVTDSCEHV